MIARVKTKPAGVLRADGTVSGLDLGVVENGFAKQEIAIGRPHKIVQRVVGIFRAESGEDALAEVCLAVAIGIA